MLAETVVRLAAAVLPAHLRDWARAMVIEVAAIERPGAALAFALGCLAGAVREAASSHLPPNRDLEGTPGMDHGSNLLSRPRRLAALCAIGATSLGLAYMGAAGAPLSCLAVNAAAVAIGLLALGVLAEASRLWRIAGAAAGVALACLVLLTSLFGISADGATRWISAGGIPLQPSLILVPVIVLGFARTRNAAWLLAVLITALGLALQPDRAMAGALAAGMTALVLARREPTVLVALCAGLASFMATLIRPDTSAASPFVDQIFYSSFAIHPLAGLAVLAGAVVMLVPAIAGFLSDSGHREAYAVFGAVWLAVILAAALGNYPTPLVGYSGSAILGYLISLLGLPPRAASRTVAREGSELEAAAEEEQRNRRERLAAAG
jgi:hypothetical protein